MKEIVILSGKGGTGKTTITGSLAVLAKNKVLADCDVDAADLHLLLDPEVKEQTEFWSGKVAHIDNDICIECGLCQELCRFDAISDYKVDPVGCEGCGFCARACPVEAISMDENLSGQWFISGTGYGPLVHAKLGVAQENSGKLVALVRSESRKLAQQVESDYVLTDGPPGIGCPVISSLSGVDLAVVVTEPTLSGIHDLERIIGLCQHFDVPSLVCINKYDINEEITKQIDEFCLSKGIEVISRIPYDESVIKALIDGVPVVEYVDSKVTKEIKSMWQRLESVLQNGKETANKNRRETVVRMAVPITGASPPSLTPFFSSNDPIPQQRAVRIAHISAFIFHPFRQCSAQTVHTTSLHRINSF